MPDRPPVQPIRVLIVDDEPLARDCVRLALEPHADVEVVAECRDGESTVAALESLAPDLVFLDVQMPGLDGFGVIERIGPDCMPPVIFVTAYDAHALRAFRVHALDFLLKPFDDRAVANAMDHARRQLGLARDGELGRRLAAVLAERAGSSPAPAPPVGESQPRTYASRVLARHDDRLEFIPLESVDWIEASGNYVRVHAGARAELVRIPLSRLLEQLDPLTFVRIHRSTAVNVQRVRTLHPWFGGDYTAVLTDGQELRVSRHYRDNLLRTVR